VSIRFVCRDPDGITITSEEENWLIQERRHEEIKEHEDWVRLTIEEPLAIYQSDTHANRKVFYRPFTFDPRVGQAWLRVVVAYNRSRLTRRVSGVFVSAFAVTGPKRSEVLLWPQ
jgi:hypothetical protein